METLAEQPVTTEVDQIYRFVDDIPAVAAARREERHVADLLLRQRRQAGVRDPSTEFLPVDALSTANAVIEAKEIHGAESSEYQDRRAGLVLDCQRLVGEWYRKLKPEYFAPVRHYFDDDTQEFFSHGLSVAQMTENAIVPLRGDSEEEGRRVNEFIEDKTPQILRGLGAVALGVESIRTISECPDTAINRFVEDQAVGNPHRGYWGYVPEIQKLMIRDIHLDPDNSDRFEEQVGLPGTYLTHEIIQMALELSGLEVSSMDKTELHGSQIIARDDLMDFVKLLDEVASEQWCVPVYMGEVVDENHPKNYESFRSEALVRQESLKDLAETTATFILDLADSDYDRRKAPAHVEDFVKRLLLDEGKKDPALAAQMFDEKTSEGLVEVAYLESIGEYERADELMREVEKAAPGGGFCGAGSCGLEGVNDKSEEGKSLADKLEAKAGDKLVKDKERSCKNCGAKKLSYAYTTKKVHTYCEGCDTLVKKTN